MARRGVMPSLPLNHLQGRSFPARFFARESVLDALNSPGWFPWHYPRWHLDYTLVERGDSSWLPNGPLMPTFAFPPFHCEEAHRG